MRIAYLIATLSHSAGSERIAVDKANALAAMGHEVFIVCFASDTACAYSIDPRVHLVSITHVVNPNDLDIRKNPFRFVRDWLRQRRSFRKRLRKFLTENKIDILSLIYAPLYLPIDMSVCPVVYESHICVGDIIKVYTSKVKRWQIRRSLRKVAAVVTLTRGDAKFWTKARRVEVIPNFTNIKPVAPYNPDTKRVVAVGRLDRQKGFDLLIAAWRKVAERYPDWHLDIYGASTESYNCEKELRRQIESSGLSDCVHLCGESDDMPRVYAAHSVFVLSSRWEGFGLVLLEAATCSLPCISYDCPEGPADILDDGRDGVLVPFRNLTDAERINALADALCRLIGDRDERLRLSAAAARAAARYDRTAIMTRWQQFFSSIQK